MRCPACQYFCHLPYQHAGLHDTAHGNMRTVNFVSEDKDFEIGNREYTQGDSGVAEMCKVHCKAQGRGHIHFLPCQKHKNMLCAENLNIPGTQLENYNLHKCAPNLKHWRELITQNINMYLFYTRFFHEESCDNLLVWCLCIVQVQGMRFANMDLILMPQKMSSLMPPSGNMLVSKTLVVRMTSGNLLDATTNAPPWLTPTPQPGLLRISPIVQRYCGICPSHNQNLKVLWWEWLRMGTTSLATTMRRLWITLFSSSTDLDPWEQKIAHQDGWSLQDGGSIIGLAVCMKLFPNSYRDIYHLVLKTLYLLFCLAALPPLHLSARIYQKPLKTNSLLTTPAVAQITIVAWERHC